MTSWGVVCDVYFLEPQNRWPGESWKEFASRVQKMIAKTADLRIVPWDGYLKYYNLGEKHPQLIEKRRKVFANSMQRYLKSSGEKEGKVETGEGLRQRTPASQEVGAP